ncbi:MAG: PolC-type DNA polymerase III [Firmicutes bacterium]|nr:PolC-type DNA polymerase III [Candidatus Fermentithermobacillaceae bacterium]
MSRTVVKPSSSNFTLEQMARTLNLDVDAVVAALKVSSITVDTKNAAWCIFVEIPDTESWTKNASKITTDEFEVCLSTIGQGIRNCVPTLSTVSWEFSEEYEKYFSKESLRLGNGSTAGSKPKQNGVLIGKPIHTEPVPIKDITGGEKGTVTILGLVVDVVWKQTQSGDFCGIVVLTDNVDSISMRIFPGQEKVHELREGIWVLARGRIRIDRMDSEPTLICNDLCVAQPKVRQDESDGKRVELHLHTKMSALDSVLDLDKAISTVARWGHPAIAITDHGVVQAFPDAYRLGAKYGIKIVLGIEGYLVEENAKDQAFHIILLARNKKGLRNLYEIVTLSHLEHFYRTPRIPRQCLADRREGLLVGSACEAGELYRAIVAGKSDDELEKIAKFYDYLEIQPLDNNAFLVDTGDVSDRQSLIDINKRIYELSKKLGKPCVATGDVHFVEPEDEIYRTLLLAGKGMNENGERPSPLYLRTTNELLDEFSSYLGNDAAREVVIESPQFIAGLVEDLPPIPEGFFYPTLEDSDQVLMDLTRQGAQRIYGEKLPEIVEQRVNKELSAIIDNGFSSLYLIAVKMVEKSKSDGYLVGSRGSVGSSLVARLAGITEVNPLPPHYVCPKCCFSEFVSDTAFHSGFDLPPAKCPKCGAELAKDGQNIPFETFMGFKGEKVPDIDLNFSGEEQAEIFKFASKLLGKKNVYRAGTIGTIGTKTAFGFVKHYGESTGRVFRRAEELRLSKGIEGVKRTTGQHPGGIMVIPQGMEVLDFTPLQYPADDRKSGSITTHFDYSAISGHLVKLDILGHDDPTVLKILHELTGLDPISIPMDDPETLRLFSGEDPDAVLGIPEFGTRFVRNMLLETKPKCFADLVRISGLSHGTDVWANNARELIRENLATLDQVIATREDIFLYLMELGLESSLAFSIAEKVRKGMPLSDEDISMMKSVSVPDWYIDSCKKITYLFPKAHAVAYVTNSFRIAYYKVHYPLAFYSTYFSFAGSSLTTDYMYQEQTQWREYIQKVGANSSATAREQDIASALELAIEMSEKGFRFGRCDLYVSEVSRYVPKGCELIPPFTAIPGIGNQAASSIVKSREEGAFESIEDFRKRTGIGKRVCEAMKDHGLLLDLPETAQLPLFQ